MSNLVKKDFFSKDGLFNLSITLENGEILFDAETVAKSLGITTIAKSGNVCVRWSRVNDYLKVSHNVVKGDFISEAAVYKLAFKASNEVAEKFQNWLADEVLPSIRRNGAYMTDDVIEKALTSPDFLIQLATNLKEEKEKRVLAEQKVEEQKPLVNFANKVSTSENSLLVREVAKIASKQGITIGERRLWNKLREWGLIFKNSTEPKQYGVDRGYFEVIEGTRENSNGTFVYKTTRVTGKGQVYIITKLQKELVVQEVACSK